MASAPRELTTSIVLMPHGHAAVASITAVVAGGGERLLRSAVEPLLTIGSGLLDQHAQLAPYPALVSTSQLHPNVGRQPVSTTNGLLVSLTGDDAEAIVDAVTGPHRPLVQLRSVGGAVNDLPPDATAYAHREHEVLLVGTTFPPAGDEELDAVWRPFADRIDGEYVGFESRPDETSFKRVYPGATGDRVRRLWTRYDPDGVFQSLWRPAPARPRR